MNTVEKKLNEIQPYEKNPRKNDDAVPYVMESIKQFGFKVPIVIDKDGVIIAGHTRYKAARKLHLDTVPCIIADDLTEEQVKAYRLADNKVSEKAEWDLELLDFELDGILDIDMEALGFELDEVEVPAEKEDKDLSDEIKSTLEVIVECESEEEQEEIFNRLVGEGLKCRVLTL